MTRTSLALAILLLAGCNANGTPGDPPGEDPSGFRLEEVARGLDQPVHLAAPAEDPRLFVVEQPGRIRIIHRDRILPQPFLSISAKVGSGGERGLLSVAFHPRYAENGYFYVNYTDTQGDTRIERYRVSADPDRADPASAHLVLHVPQPFGNHNGGQIAFGPDGMLYVGMGDGGSGGDPQGHGQNRETLLGALLRLDVDGGDPYAVPADNPFVGGGGRGEIWAYGLRNPWRFSFDREAGLLFVADVGQNRREEVNAVPADAAGLDYGWNAMEGSACFPPNSECDPAGRVLPVLEYEQSGGACSVTGGFVYRGRVLPFLRGHYFYSDYCTGWLRSFRYEDGEAVDRKEWEVGSLGNVTSFGEDGFGELYVLTHGGRVLQLIADW
jgi:glucose/arabinose dehydrogenase